MHTYTYDKLAKNTVIFSKGTPNPTKRYEVELILPYIGTKSVLVKLKAWGTTQHNIHNVTLLFNDCEILEGEQKVSLWEYFKIDYQGKVYYIKKFNKFRNPLTWRCTCFTEDTEFYLADGTTATFKEMEGKEFDVLSYNEQADKFESVHAYDCTKRKQNVNLLKVTLDDGTEIKCTPDHKFLTREGNWINAENLTIGESLRAFYGKNTLNGLIRVNPDNTTQKVLPHKPEEKFYLYVYLDPRYPGKYEYKTCCFDYKPIYVGKGTRNRCRVHLSSKDTDRFHNTVRKLCKLGLPPIILKQKENLTESVAYRLEKELTQEIGLLCENKGPLLNAKHGGENCDIIKIEQQFKNNSGSCYINHKIVSIEKIENQDVYCLTTEYLGNFIIKATTSNNVKSGVVVSNCQSAFYSFVYAAYRYGKCLYGPPPRMYIRKTKTRPPRNPRNMIAVCKHVYHAWQFLRQKGLTIN